MQYLSVAETAEKWSLSERSVRNYCAHERVEGAFITGKTWNIPEHAKKPERSNKKREKHRTLLDILQEEKSAGYSGGIYHKTQIELTYPSGIHYVFQLLSVLDIFSTIFVLNNYKGE